MGCFAWIALSNRGKRAPIAFFRAKDAVVLGLLILVIDKSQTRCSFLIKRNETKDKAQKSAIFIAK